MSLKNWLLNRDKIENPAKLTWKNIVKYIQGTYFRIVMSIPILRDKLIRLSRKEQIAWRRTQVAIKSPECFTSSVCYCGCDVEGLIAADPECEQKNHCFPAMMDTETWKQFKTKNNI